MKDTLSFILRQPLPFDASLSFLPCLVLACWGIAWACFGLGLWAVGFGLWLGLSRLFLVLRSWCLWGSSVFRMRLKPSFLWSSGSRSFVLWSLSFDFGLTLTLGLGSLVFGTWSLFFDPWSLFFGLLGIGLLKVRVKLNPWSLVFGPLLLVVLFWTLF